MPRATRRAVDPRRMTTRRSNENTVPQSRWDPMGPPPHGYMHEEAKMQPPCGSPCNLRPNHHQAYSDPTLTYSSISSSSSPFSPQPPTHRLCHLSPSLSPDPY